MSQDILELMNRRERQILVHSCLYYRLDSSIIDDHTYDYWCKELADLIVAHPEVFKQTAHYQDYIGFDGSTGMDLPIGNPEVYSRAVQLLEYHRRVQHEQREKRKAD